MVNTAAYPAVKVPTLVLHREGDRWHPQAEAHTWRDLLLAPSYASFPVMTTSLVGDQDRLIGEIEEFVTGRRTSAAPERPLLTVLMTDIVSLTEALSAVGDDRWRSVLEQIDKAWTGASQDRVESGQNGWYGD